MTTTFSEKLNNVLHQCYGTEDALMRTYDLPADGKYDMIVISPVWNPGDVLRNDSIEIHCLRNRNTTGGYLVHYGGKTIAWIRTGACAGNVVDACLALAYTACDKVLFLGTCTALKPDLAAGDLVVPNKAISGTGATRYLLDDMEGDPTFLQERRTPPKGILWLSKAAIRAEAKLNTRTVFSTDTLMGGLLHRREILATGADVLDMESAAFTRCMSIMERPGVALLTVVGNASNGSAMLRIQPEDDERLNKTLNKAICQLVLELV